MRSDAKFFAYLLGALAERVTRHVLSTRDHFATRRNKLKLVFIALCVGCTLAISQSPPPAAPKTNTAADYDFSKDSVIKDISNAVSTKLKELQNNTKLESAGKLISAFFLIAMLIWTSLKTMAGAKGIGELIGEWIPIFISFGIVTLFLDKSGAYYIVDTMDNIGAAIGGANMATLESAIRTGAEPIFTSIAAVLNQPRATAGTNAVLGGGLAGFLGDVTASAASWVMGVIAKLLTALVLVAAGVVMIGHIIMGFISVALVLALAPVMVPFLMFRPLSWLFDGWLKFLLGACMLKVVVAFLLMVVAALLSEMSKIATKQYIESFKVTATETLHVDILMLGMTLVFALLGMLLLMQAPGIATGLLSGSAGSIGFSGVKGVTQGVAGRVSSNATTGVAAGAGAAGGQVLRNTMSKAAGYLDGKAGRAQSLAYRDPKAAAAYKVAYRNAKPPPPPAPTP